MFFRKDYAAPGPGVDPNAPEKTGLRRFFEILQLECGTLLKLNLLFLISSIPLVTLPAALFAMHQVVRRMILDQPVDCFYHYRMAWKRFWKTAYAAFLLVAVPLAGAGYGVLTYLRFAAENPLFFLPFMLCSTVFLVTMLASTYFYPILSTGVPLKKAIRPAVVLGAAKPLRALAAAVCVYGLPLMAALAFPISILYLVMIGFSLPCLLGNFFVRTVIRQYFGAQETDET